MCYSGKIKSSKLYTECTDTELIHKINKTLDEHIREADCWIQHECFTGNTDKESWWRGARAQALKFKAILNNEIYGRIK
jgi:hypothetical protein